MTRDQHHTNGTTPDISSDAFDRFAADPFGSATPTPAAQPTPPAQLQRHGWLRHLLMCAPMLAVVAFLVATGGAGAGAIGYALLCVVMMGAMMLFMNHSSSGSHHH